MKVGLYARVSMEEGDSKDRRYQEPENQLQPLREWAARMGWEIFNEYVDRGSGANPNREAFNRMISDAMLMRFNNILVWKLDRFSRENMSVCVGRIQKLKERGIGLKSLTESWLDTSKENPMNELIMVFMAWAAGEERRKISERTKAGIARRRAIGQWKGGRPRNSLSEADFLEAKRLFEKGKSIPSISRRFKVNRDVLKDLFEKGGVLSIDKPSL